MRLLLKGSVVNQGRGANFEKACDDLPSLVGKPIRYPLDDTCLEIIEVNDDLVIFSYSYFEKPHSFCLKPGESATFKQEGNAFVLEVFFVLEASA